MGKRKNNKKILPTLTRWDVRFSTANYIFIKNRLVVKISRERTDFVASWCDRKTRWKTNVFSKQVATSDIVGRTQGDPSRMVEMSRGKRRFWNSGLDFDGLIGFELLSKIWSEFGPEWGRWEVNHLVDIDTSKMGESSRGSGRKMWSVKVASTRT